MADRDISAVVWGETSALHARNGDPQTMQRLHAVVARMAIKAKARGQLDSFRKAAAPSVHDEQAATYQAMVAIIDKVEAGALQIAVPLLSRAVLWEINELGEPRKKRPLPVCGNWFIRSPTETTSDDAQDFAASRTIYRLYESSKALEDGDLPFMSRTSPALACPLRSPTSASTGSSVSRAPRYSSLRRSVCNGQRPR